MTHLKPGEIHLWHIDLAGDSDNASLDELSAAERARALRFVRAHDRERYVHSHAALRNILGLYLDDDPARIEFAIGPEGKPCVPGVALHFNLSHSANRAVVALTLDGQIGVDIEEQREMQDCIELAAQCFSAAENAQLKSQPAREQPRSFLVCWTRKEALLKAIGVGLQGLPWAEVGIEPVHSTVRAIHSSGAKDFRLQTLLQWPPAIVSVAGPTDALQLKCRQWPGVRESSAVPLGLI